MKTKKFIVIAVVVALILAATYVYRSGDQSEDAFVGATPGSLLIEQYSPYVQQNGGISSALPIQTTSTVTAADITVSGATTFSGAATIGTSASGTTTIGGITQVYKRDSFTSATTTPSRVISPTATSTVSGTCQLTTSSTTASLVTISQSTSGYSTTTGVMATSSIAANGQKTINLHASSTASAVNNQILVDSWTVPPSTFIVMGMQGGIGTFSPVGSCNYVFTQAN